MTEIIAECATGHGGDLDIAADMVRAAADSGADWVKFQTYDLAKLHPADPQAAWLTQAHLDKAAHERLMRVAAQAGIKFLSTPFDAGSLRMLHSLGLRTFKIASSESENEWWRLNAEDFQAEWLVSWPWGMKDWPDTASTVFDWRPRIKAHLTAIPMYPTPLEVVGRATLLDGWSDHCEGIAACQWAIAQGAKMVEVHLTIPGARCKPWDKRPHEIEQLRLFADACETMRSGVGRVFRERWRRA